MVDTLAHRGPDDEGLHLAEGVGLGHRRLSIIDLEGGHQPMGNENSTVWIVFNGELYNYRDLKASLREPHSFRTESDTEVLLHLYEERGPECVRSLRGMFAFAIWDARDRSLFLARDHLGQKPLYYFQEGETFAFASEIKALLALRPELAELDRESLYEYLSVRIITPPRSMFRRIRKLAPGHTLRLRKGRLSEERYWSLRFEPKKGLGFEEALEELDARVHDTVRYHLVSDVEVGSFLSGGLDSSLILSVMSQEYDRPVKTFTGDVPYEGYSELPFARSVCERYGAEGHEFTIRPSLLRSLPRVVWHLDEPSDPLSTCLYYLSRLARRHVKVVLGGDGGDELFGGYDRYYGNLYVSWYAMLPEGLRRHLMGRLLSLVPEGFWYRSMSHRLRWMHELSFHQEGGRYAKSLGYFYFSDRFRASLYTPEFLAAVGAFDPEAAIKRSFDAATADEAIDRMLHADCMTRLPDHPVMILDRMTMAHGLESRSPFLDHELAEFCAALPPSYKIRGRRTRYIQHALARRYLPDDVLTREKQGFASPFPYLLAEEFGLLYRIFLERSSLVRDGHLQQQGIDALLADHRTGKVDHGQRLWLLCNAEIWYRMYVEGQGRDALQEHIDRSVAVLAPEASREKDE